MTGFLIGVDVGATNVRVGIAPLDDLRIETVTKIKKSTEKTDPGALSRQVIGMIEESVAVQGTTAEEISAISIATAGPFDMEKGEIFNNANLGFKTIPLRAPIEDRFHGIPLSIMNDCDGAVIGVHFFEAKDDEKQDLTYLTLSTGIGAGVICNGHLVLGKDGNATEIGHGTLAAHSGQMCACGCEGCWEAFSSGTGIANRVQQLIGKRKKDAKILFQLVDRKVERITSKEVYEAARSGDKLSKYLVDDANYFNAIGIGLLNNFYDCKVIYMGGSIMNDEAQIMPVLRQWFQNDPIKFTVNHPPRLEKTTLGDEVGLLGAIALGKYRLENNPIIQ
jgi:glucokinase